MLNNNNNINNNSNECFQVQFLQRARYSYIKKDNRNIKLMETID